MPSKIGRTANYSRQLAVLGSLLVSTLLCAGLLLLRVERSHHRTYAWLLWNLFLAWLPAGFALIAYNVNSRYAWLRWILVSGCALLWLVFLPNAPYLVTDIIHLHPQGDVPFWFDLILLVAFAWTGLFLGFVSLFLMQETVRGATGSVVSWLFAVVVLGLSGFGIYLGRFLRWNSWDVFSEPAQVFGALGEGLRHPGAHLSAIVFSLIFAVFFGCVYLMLMSLAHFQRREQSS